MIYGRYSICKAIRSSCEALLWICSLSWQHTRHLPRHVCDINLTLPSATTLRSTTRKVLKFNTAAQSVMPFAASQFKWVGRFCSCSKNQTQTPNLMHTPYQQCSVDNVNTFLTTSSFQLHGSQGKRSYRDIRS